MDFANLAIKLKSISKTDSSADKENVSCRVELNYDNPDDFFVTPDIEGNANFILNNLRELELDYYQYGIQLWKDLLSDTSNLKYFYHCMQRTEKSGESIEPLSLRIQLFIDHDLTALHELHWESLRDPHGTGWLTTNSKIMFSRLIYSDQYTKGIDLNRPSPLRVLVVIASPLDVPQIDVTSMKELVDRSLKINPSDEIIIDELISDPKSPGRVSREKLKQKLLNRRYDLLFMVAHGYLWPDKEHVFALENNNGHLDAVKSRFLIDCISDLDEKSRPLLVILVSCDSAKNIGSIGPQLTKAGVPAVIAMHKKVSMRTMDEFLPILFENLRQNKYIDQAVSYARSQVSDSYDGWMPVLFMHLKDGRLWPDKQPIPLDQKPPPKPPNTIRELPKPYIERSDVWLGLPEIFASGSMGVIITGEGYSAGIGKSTIARRLAHHIGDRYPGGSLEVDLRGTARPPHKHREPSEVMRALLAWFIPKESLPDEPDQLTDLYINTFRQNKVLILLDDARDYAQVKNLIPPPPSSAIITTRNKISLLNADYEEVHIPPFNQQESHELLLQICPNLNAENPISLNKLIDLCGNLPLALLISASILKNRHDWDLSDLLSNLEDKGSRLKVLSLEDLSLHASIELSYLSLPSDLQECFRALGVFSEPFNFKAFSSIISDVAATAHKLREYITFLQNRGLLEYNEKTNCYGMNQFVMLFAYEQLIDSEQVAKKVLKKYAQYYMAEASRLNNLLVNRSKPVNEIMLNFDSIWPHLNEAWLRISGIEKDWPEIPHKELWLCEFPIKISELMSKRLSATDQLKYYDRSLQAASLLNNTSCQLQIHRGLGNIYFDFRNFDKAKEHYLKCHNLSEMNDDLNGICSSNIGLGHIYSILGDVDESIVHYKNSLNCAKQNNDLKRQCDSLISLGIAYTNKKDYESAIDTYYKQAWEIAKQTDEYDQAAAIMNNIGYIYVNFKKDNKKAFLYYKKALEYTLRTEDHRNAVKILLNLIKTSISLEKHQECYDYFLQCIQITRSKGKDPYFRRIERDAKISFGDAQKNLGNYNEAKMYYHQALEITEELDDLSAKGSLLEKLADTPNSIEY